MSKVGFLVAGLVVAWVAACSGESRVEAPTWNGTHAETASLEASLMDDIDSGESTSDAL